MPTGEHPFEERAMDFVRELPELQAFNVILVVTDWFTKVLLYILFKTTWTAKDIVNSYINDIWKLYALLKHLTSDRGSQFDSKFLKQLNRKLSFNLCLSTAYHLQTDRLREWEVQTLEQYLCIYCHNRQTYWWAWLPRAECAYNTTGTTPHKLFPYESLYGYNSHTIYLDNDYELSSPTIEE